MRDPILHALGVIINRTLLFIGLSLAQAIELWLWFWMHFKHWSLLEAVRAVAEAWPLSFDVFASVVAMAVVWIGIANSAILYLALGRWWQSRGDVMHRRGSRLEEI